MRDRNRNGWGALAVLAMAALSACSSTPNPMAEGIGFRENRLQEVSAMRQFRACRDEALELDRQARASAAPARYLASARLIEKCESDVGPGANGVGQEERMRAWALGIQNYLKGGDVPKARSNLESLKATFSGQDLYYPDGASFTETMELLLGLRDKSAVGEFSAVNAPAVVKDELRRVRYWTRN